MRSYVIDNALPSTQELFSIACEEEARFKPIHFIANTLILKLLSLPDYRGKMAHSPKIESRTVPFLDSLRERRDDIRNHFGMNKFDWLRASMTVSAMGNGDVLARHSDINRFYGSNIELLFLLYFSAYPKMFSGGELVLHWPDGDEIIEPNDNRFVAFPPTLPHSVTPVVVNKGGFEASRFAVVGRIIGRTTVKEYFYRTVNSNYKLLSRIRRKAKAYVST